MPDLFRVHTRNSRLSLSYISAKGGEGDKRCVITYNTFKQRVCPLEERLAMLDVPKVKQFLDVISLFHNCFEHF